MKNSANLFLVNSDLAKKFAQTHKFDFELLPVEDLLKKNDIYSESIVFIDNNPDFRELIKDAIIINPGIKFILYYNEPISIPDLVEYVKNGIIESVQLDDQEQISNYIKRYKKESRESRLNLYNNLIKNFREVGIITNSLKMGEIFARIEKIARSDATVLINGENGTGKELLAKSIHYFSKRRNNKFIPVNTGAIPENLLEDELFGHVKGAFTTAVKDRKGKFEYANSGTIFLDEISNMPPSLQIKMLRILQEREFERVGDNLTIKVDVRVISATNVDLLKMVKKRTFREDLYYRLNVIPVHLPPLRERKIDVPMLANYFVLKFCKLNNLSPKSFSLPAIRLLQSYSWPGNIRQLENIIERMVVLNPDVPLFLPQNIPDEVKPEFDEESNIGFPAEIPEEGVSLNDIIKDIEKKLILNSLEKTSWNKQKAADLLNIKRTTLIEKIKKIQK